MGALEQRECEVCAGEMLRKAGAPRDEVWLSTQVMRGLYGKQSVRTVDELDVDACMLPLSAGPRMVISRSSQDPNFDGGHELGHVGWWAFLHRKGTRAEEERAANMIGAAIVAPALLVQRAYKHYGESLPAIAASFRISLTAATLRLAEVLGDDRAVVTKNRNVIRRGFRGVDDRQLLLWSATPPRDIVKVRIDGMPFEQDRIVLRAR